MSIFKKIFCSHFWKTDSNEFLRNETVYGYAGASCDSDIYDVYLLTSECAKCGKIKQKEKFKRII